MQKRKILLIIVLSIIILSIFLKRKKVIKDMDPNKKNLNENGFVIFKSFIDSNQIVDFKDKIIKKKLNDIKKEITNSSKIKNKCINLLGTSYIFQDYILGIIKSLVHTCHRDYNGDFFNKNQKMPSYTILIFLEDMDYSLDVIPKSHKNKFNNLFNFTDNTVSINCKKGDAILFNANLIHSGSFNKKLDNMRIQMKLTHKDDIESIKYYQNYNKYIDKTNNIPLYLKKIQKHISCQFPVFSDITQNIGINDSSNGSNISLGQRIFSTLFYADPNYYILPSSK